MTPMAGASNQAKRVNCNDCYEAMRQKPLPPYDKDPFFDLPVIRRRVGEIIARAAVQSQKDRSWG